MPLLANLTLLIALFLSANIALMWGELASYDVHGDKSGLAGLGAGFFLMVMRWGALALALLIAAARGGFEDLPGSRSVQAVALLLAHALLGVVSYRGLEWMTAAIQRSDAGPLRWAWAFALLLPLPAFLAAFWGVNRAWIGRHPLLGLSIAAGLLAAHYAGWREGR